ncbi:uncharacterized protein L969DRAFT_46197 [Mixia osmundae IAM 14324]|uniref:FAS1 domain-containing protein n=1 Tax=Mixia osmundae (strain CBS 9802 / IAM 14324 / JCM 22182 / KY 12970) TaxID=764103 RepID=G7DUA2_MIXOS|nr:uncharacterized protein L969DRAFT_46197 [Mixia osmundae IAM 14324]KEI41033.1 hypothetical protein L969DRAFT_46197 [Mixia osmundae IAM 14324]GAA94162.1 hypothetical protein E5Q_00810 [Mixia osmundae IAM 14324]
MLLRILFLIATASLALSEPIISALRTAGYTQTAAFLAAHPAYAKAIFGVPGYRGDVTFLAPSDAAWKELAPSQNNRTFLGEVLLPLHLLRDQINPKTVAHAPAHTIVRTACFTGTNLGKHAPAPAFLSIAEDGSLQHLSRMINTGTTVDTSKNIVSDEGVIVYGVDAWSEVPAPMHTAVSSVAAQASEYPGMLRLADANGNLVYQIEAGTAVTLFVPLNDIIIRDLAKLKAMPAWQLVALFSNNIIKGATIYSTQINGVLTASSAAGTPITIKRPATGGFTVTNNGQTFEVYAADIPMSNGVVHILQGYFDNTEAHWQFGNAAIAKYLSYTNSGIVPSWGEIDDMTPNTLGSRTLGK